VTLASIVLGIVLITAMRGFTWGASKLMVLDVVDGRTGALQIHRAGWFESLDADPSALHMPYEPALLERIAAVPGVTAVAGRIGFNGLVSNGKAQTLFVGRGIDLEREKAVCPRSGAEVREGGVPLSPGDQNAGLIGYELGLAFGVGTRDVVTLSSSSPGGRANAVDVPVKGLTVTNLPFENKRVVTVPLALAQSLLGLEGRVTEYAVAVGDLAELDAVAARLRQALGPEYEVHTWRELQPFVRDVINRHNFIRPVSRFPGGSTAHGEPWGRRSEIWPFCQFTR